jgi:hypothetical protein
MSASEPVVEVLTAEIRVLQVGSKPIALSAARQLDVVDPSVIKPFGRVRIDPKPDKGVIEVIGSGGRSTGQVLSPRPESGMPGI